MKTKPGGKKETERDKKMRWRETNVQMLNPAILELTTNPFNDSLCKLINLLLKPI